MNTLKARSMVTSLTATAMLLSSFFSFGIANAADNPSPPPTPVTTIPELTTVICNFVAYFFWTVMIVSVIFVLVAAFNYVTAGDDTEKTSKARRTLTYAAIGIAVALLAIGVPNIVASLFPNAPNLAVASLCKF